ncbi:peptidylprolyl isomerase [Chamaesiphon minutus]|uniref:peptidylprolyl isomerase n=1 Tax=Chamaesiphon minutus (strain ATCC 27169 / PCC 6605) TaxID=1173020 RepID=K9UJP7_CHAP6|nr:peptidylprolyl isomerase [Chamaesiphon minutus]AFY94681.1 peptidyl-prolyl cis-trans isomerase (rotamase) - cyclophilin family [Chamaesiphon minutus PCC 6605]
MRTGKISILSRWRNWLQTGIVAMLSISLSMGLSAATLLPSGNAITDGQSILRYALPIDNKPVRELQNSLEDIANHLRGKQWSTISNDVKKAAAILKNKQADILTSVPAPKQAEAQTLLDDIQTDVEALAIATAAKDKPQVQAKRTEALGKIGSIEASMVTDFPYTVPAEYSNLPQLKGRATISIKTNKGEIGLIVDGYNAPVTAGNFVDLVQRGFYNNLAFTRAENDYVLQIGDPPGDEVGFIDPDTKKYRAVPLEVMVKGDKEPMYGITMEDAGRFREEPVLPFSSYGALAMARPEGDPNGGSSQVFFFLFEPELTPAGRNLLDGRYTVFGYAISGQEVLGQLKPNDKIESAKVIEGADLLKT